MKIKSILTKGAVAAMNYRNTFHAAKDQLEFVEHLGCVMIENRVLIPISTLLEIIIEPEPEVVSKKSAAKKPLQIN